MWKPEHRAADRNHLRYPSDLTDAEWALVEPLIPPGRHGGRKRSVRRQFQHIHFGKWPHAQEVWQEDSVRRQFQPVQLLL
jgi:transposase